MLRIIKIVMSKTYVQKALILNGFFLLAQPPGERERTIVVSRVYNNSIGGECLTAIDTPNTLR